LALKPTLRAIVERVGTSSIIIIEVVAYPLCHPASTTVQPLSVQND
jgi:hypothetical protein